MIEHHDKLTDFLRSGTSLGGLRYSVLKDFSNDIAKGELQVLGLVGKYLTGPWMTKFYTSADTEINHVDGIKLVQDVITRVKDMMQNPTEILCSNQNFFGEEIEVDSTLLALRTLPTHPEFASMMLSCLKAVVDVLERQYSKYFLLDITEKLRQESESAKSHNMDSEEIMGMFSAAQQKSPHATLCFLSSRMRACKNKTVAYIDALPVEQQENIVNKAIRYGRLQRESRKKMQKKLN